MEIFIFIGLLLLLGFIGTVGLIRRDKASRHKDHVHVSIHDKSAKSGVLSVTEHANSNYSFRLVWRRGSLEYFVVHVYNKAELLTTEIFETEIQAEEWIDDCAKFLNKTSYTVKKELG